MLHTLQIMIYTIIATPLFILSQLQTLCIMIRVHTLYVMVQTFYIVIHAYKYIMIANRSGKNNKIILLNNFPILYGSQRAQESLMAVAKMQTMMDVNDALYAHILNDNAKKAKNITRALSSDLKLLWQHKLLCFLLKAQFS